MAHDPAPATDALWSALDFACRAQPNLTLTELRTLIAVAREEGMSVLSVARVCGFTGATASRTLRGMASPDAPAALKPGRGLVVLMRGPDEERSRFAFLTPAGRAFCEELARRLVDNPTTRSGEGSLQKVSPDLNERILAIL